MPFQLFWRFIDPTSRKMYAIMFAKGIAFFLGLYDSERVLFEIAKFLVYFNKGFWFWLDLPRNHAASHSLFSADIPPWAAILHKRWNSVMRLIVLMWNKSQILWLRHRLVYLSGLHTPGPPSTTPLGSSTTYAPLNI